MKRKRKLTTVQINTLQSAARRFGEPKDNSGRSMDRCQPAPITLAPVPKPKTEEEAE